MPTGNTNHSKIPDPDAPALTTKSATYEAPVTSVIDLTQAWEEATGTASLAMGCIVARRAFVEEHPDLVETFLKEYAASIDYVKSSPKEASGLVAQYGITPSAAVAEAAIPACNLVYISGLDARDLIQDYYEVLAEADLSSIGGSIPNDAFYYIP